MLSKNTEDVSKLGSYEVEKFKEFFHYMLNETDGKKFEGTYDDSFYLNGLLWALQVF